MRFQLFPALLLASAAMLQGAQPTFIQNARVFDGVRMLPRANVLIVDGKIEALGPDLRPPAGAKIIDVTGNCLLPGLIDAHAHIQSPDDLKTALNFGVTTYLDMFTLHSLAAAMRAEQQAGKALDRADLRSAGTLVTAPGGHGTEYGVPIPTLSRPEDAQAFIDARIAEGSDYIKLVKDDGSAFGFHRPTLDRPTLAAAIAAAHLRKKLAIVHIATLQDARDALESGADGIAHIYAGPPDRGIAREAAAHHAFWTPTLAVITQGCAKPEACTAGFEIVRQMKAAGVRILAGTDVPNPGTAHGTSLHTELELLVKAGLTPLEALAAATSQAADAFGLSDRGRIAPGLRADLLLVQGEPDRDIRATRDIAAVWKLGVAVALASQSPAPIRTAPGAVSETRPNFTGTWKLNETASATPAGGVREVVFTIEHKDPNFKYSATGKRAFNATFSEAYECTTDGKLPADPAKVSMAGNWQGAALVLSLYKDGKELMKFSFKVSADGRQMTREADLPGGRKVREIYDRQD
jgi:imidazolonepropionase-like amidohydrolase